MRVSIGRWIALAAVLPAILVGCAGPQTGTAEERVVFFSELDGTLKSWEAAVRAGESFRSDELEDQIRGMLTGRFERMVAVFEGGNPYERAVVASAVAFANDDRYTAYLTLALDDPSDAVVANALTSLGIMRYPLVDQKRVLRLLGSRSPDIRAAAVLYAGQIVTLYGDEDVLVPISMAARDGNPEVRQNAYLALGQIKDPEVVPNIAGRGLNDADPIVRSAASRALGMIGDRRGMVALEAAFATEKHPRVRREMASSLARLRNLGPMPDASASPAIRRGARAPRPLPDGATATAPPADPPPAAAPDPGTKPPSVEPPLARRPAPAPALPLARPPYPGTHAGKEPPARVGAPPADPRPTATPVKRDPGEYAALIEDLDRANGETLNAARAALAAGGPAAAAAMTARLPGANAELAVQLVQLLARHERPELAQTLGQALTHPALLVRLAAVDGLQRLVGAQGRPYYIKALDDRSPKVRRKAARLLVQHKDKRGIPELIRGLSSQDTYVRFNAIEVLRGATGQSFEFRPDGPTADREQAVRRWDRWWRDEGPQFHIR